MSLNRETVMYSCNSTGTAIGRSNPLPSFFRSAGDKLTVRLAVGALNPILCIDTLIDLLEKRLVDQVLDAAHRKMRYEVLPVAKVTKGVENIENFRFKIVERLGLLFHAEP